MSWWPLYLEVLGAFGVMNECFIKLGRILTPPQYWTSLVAQTVKSLPDMQETQVQSLGGEDPLEKGTATHSSVLAWRIPWTEEPGGLQSMGFQSWT